MNGKTLQKMLPKIKFRWCCEIIVNGIKQVLKKSASARLTKYRLVIKRVRPPLENMTDRAAEFPIMAVKKTSHEAPCTKLSTGFLIDSLKKDNVVFL